MFLCCNHTRIHASITPKMPHLSHTISMPQRITTPKAVAVDSLLIVSKDITMNTIEIAVLCLDPAQRRTRITKPKSSYSSQISLCVLLESLACIITFYNRNMKKICNYWQCALISTDWMTNCVMHVADILAMMPANSMRATTNAL